MIVKKILVALIMSLILNLNCYIVQAAIQNNGITISTNASGPTNAVKPGSTFGITVKISGASKKIASGDVTLKYDASKFEYVNFNLPSGYTGGDANSLNGKVIFLYYDERGGTNAISGEQFVTFNFKTRNIPDTTGDFTYTIRGFSDENGDSYTISNNSASTKVTIHSPSTNNYLSSLSVSGGTLTPTFDKNINSYNVNVESNIGSVTISGKAEDSKAKILNLGKKELKYGQNLFKIQVQSESGDLRTYSININRKDGRSSDTSLKDLKISNTNFQFKGSSPYVVDVKYEVSSVEISATPKDSKSKINGTGKRNLKVGKNNFVIDVIAENGTKSSYTVIISRAKNPNDNAIKPKSNNNFIKSVTIDGCNFNFNKNIYDYKLTVLSTQDVLNINYRLEDKAATAKIVGGPKLEYGNNSITILVSAENGEIREYKFEIIREEESKKVENNKESIINALNGNDVELFIQIKEGEYPTALDEDIIKLLKDKNKSIIYEWYNSVEMISSLKIVNMNLSDGVMVKPVLNPELQNQTLIDYTLNKKTIKVNFNGTNIPLGSLYRTKVDNQNKNYKLAYVLDNKVITEDLVNKGGYVEFSLNNTLEYAILEEEVVEESVITQKTEKTKFAWLLPTLIAMILGLILSIIFVIIFRNKRNKLD